MDHIISLVVQDSTGIWSNEVSQILIVHEKAQVIIQSIIPSPALFGNTVNLSANGTDDGLITKYVWISPIDGELYNGPTSNFSLATISIGNHTISLKVQDDLGAWSD